MAIIRVLDKHTAELIAAGEVVERPASVAKELMENSIDAGATQITVSIESGGVKLIEVSDNRSGLDPEHISPAFLRHAARYVTHPSDLNPLPPRAFRREPLPPPAPAPTAPPGCPGPWAPRTRVPSASASPGTTPRRRWTGRWRPSGSWRSDFENGQCTQRGPRH